MIVLVLLISRRTLVSADYSCNTPPGQLYLSPRKFKFCSKFSFPIILHLKASSMHCPCKHRLVWLPASWKDSFHSPWSHQRCPSPWFLPLPPPLLSHETQYYHAYLHIQAPIFANIVSQVVLAFALIGHLLPILPFGFKSSSEHLCACCLNTQETPSPKQPQSCLDVVPQTLPSIAMISTKNLTS